MKSMVEIRRSKIIRQLQQSSKESYFKKIREELVINIDQANLNRESTQLAERLRHLIRLSIEQNRLLRAIRQDGLLDQLQRQINNTSTGRQIELVLILLSNLLLDSVSLSEKQQIAVLWLQAYRHPSLSLQLNINDQTNLSCLLSLSHSLRTIAGILPYIQQTLAIQCQEVMVGEVVKFMADLMKCMKNSDLEVRNLVENVGKQLIQTIKTFCYVGSENRTELNSKFEKYVANFIEILRIHYQALPLLEQCQNFLSLHHSLLEVYQLLTQQVQLLDFPLFFESIDLVNILYWQICLNPFLPSTSISLTIVANLFYQYGQHMPAFLDVWSKVLKNNGSQLLFRELLRRDQEREKRITLLEIWICDDYAFETIDSFFREQWRDIVDLCSNTVCSDFNSLNIIDIALKLLINSQLRLKQSNQHDEFVSYFQSIGGISGLQTLMLAYPAQHRDYSQQTEPLTDKCYQLLQLSCSPL